MLLLLLLLLLPVTQTTSHLPLSKCHIAHSFLLSLFQYRRYNIFLHLFWKNFCSSFFLSRGFKCQQEMFLLNPSVSPHHAVPLGRGISSEKRKPLPHYAANFRHKEKMFAKVLAHIPSACSGTLHSLGSHGFRSGDFGYLSELKETIYNVYSENFKSVLSKSGIGCE